MSFKHLIETEKENINESPVGQRGRTSVADAQSFIKENPHLIDEFKKIVIKMGGKAVASHILTVMNLKPNAGVVGESATDTPEAYLRDIGYKIKDIIPFKDGYTISLYKPQLEKEAFEMLKTEGFLKKMNVYLTAAGINVEDK